MGEKAGNSVTTKDLQVLEFSPKEMAILDQIGTTKTTKMVSALAKRFGCDVRTMYRSLRQVKASDWVKRQKEKLELTEDLVFANFVYNNLQGNYRAFEGYYKGTGVWRDKLEVSGSIEQKLSDEEITDKAKQVILEVIQEAKAKDQVKAVSCETKVLQGGEVKGEVVEIEEIKTKPVEPSTLEPRPPSPRPPDED